MNAAVLHAGRLKPHTGEMPGEKIYLYVMRVVFDMPNLRKDVHYVIMFREKRIRMADAVHNVEEVGCEFLVVTVCCKLC